MARWTTRWKPLVGDGSVAASNLQRLQLGVEIVGDGLLELRQVDAARSHHLAAMLVIDQREQQMLERGIFVAPRRGGFERAVQGGL